jgi:hypothetical protein
MAKQTTDTILMVRPAHFGFNEQTAGDNAFQVDDGSLSQEEIRQKAVREFDEFVENLRSAGIRVVVAQDTDAPVKTDAVFPNNWVTFHENGAVVTYPMSAPVRRLERREDILEDLGRQFRVGERLHLEKYEQEGRFLEGTGSMILDRENRIVYACLSPRTDEGLLDEFCRLLGYEKVSFTAVDGNGRRIYHTNVMMALGESFVIICLETVKDALEKQLLRKKFAETEKELIEITLDQMLAFAGNMLQVRNQDGELFLVMSEQAFNSLDDEQLEEIMKHTDILYSPIPTIEKYGGGSARCMMAEVFLQEK